jgi:hypothetical protein
MKNISRQDAKEEKTPRRRVKNLCAFASFAPLREKK